MKNRTCSIEGCDNRHEAHGLCMKHLRRKQRRDNPKTRKTADQRFWERVEMTDGCWLWTGLLSTYGYGRFTVGRKEFIAHRWLYLTLVGPIQDSLELDHLCRVRRCVNPSHMEPVTPRVNVLRSTSFSAINAAKTQCKNGHLFNEENTYLIPTGGRYCRVCDRERKRAAKAAKRAA